MSKLIFFFFTMMCFSLEVSSIEKFKLSEIANNLSELTKIISNFWEFEFFNWRHFKTKAHHSKEKEYQFTHDLNYTALIRLLPICPMDKVQTNALCIPWNNCCITTDMIS